MKKHFLLTFFTLTALLIFVVSCDDKNKKLRETVNADERLQTVKQMAEDLVSTGLNAGDGYTEVWIRDLNTFVETACNVGQADATREALITFFKFQGKDGNIPDGYTLKERSYGAYNFIYSELEPNFSAHKNTVETDQESSLIQAISKYIYTTGDKSILKEQIEGRTVEQRLSDAMKYLMADRYNEEYGLLWGATTSDWGDVQPEHEWGVYLDSTSHLSIDIYDNAMFVVAMNNYMEMIDNKEEISYWKGVRDKIKENTRKHLWDESRQKFIPHIYLNGSPFPADFDEGQVYYHGGTTIAIEAGMLSKEEILTVYKQMLANVEAAHAQSIGLTVYPPYPNGFFKNPWMGEYSYQNGGDWTWFGGRTIQVLIRNGFYEEAYASLIPMLDRVIKNKGFYEWWTPAGVPSGSSSFRGSAGVLWKAIEMLDEALKKK